MGQTLDGRLLEFSSKMTIDLTDAELAAVTAAIRTGGKKGEKLFRRERA